MKELRVKESDRLKLILLNLESCVDCKSENDDLFINPSKKYKIKKILFKLTLIIVLQWHFVLWVQK